MRRSIAATTSRARRVKAEEKRQRQKKKGLNGWTTETKSASSSGQGPTDSKRGSSEDAPSSPELTACVS